MKIAHQARVFKEWQPLLGVGVWAVRCLCGFKAHHPAWQPVLKEAFWHVDHCGERE